MTVYVPEIVEKVLDLYPCVREEDFQRLSIRDQIAMQASTLHKAHAAGDERVEMQILSWWPDASGKSLDQVLNQPYSRQDAMLTVSREYGFPDWATVNGLGNFGLDISFVQALDDTLSGNIAALKSRLDANPGLATERARFGHRATLLHYLGANGVESYRQQVPLNAVEMAELLITFGADLTSKANIYGGNQTPFDLADTSAHPCEAGVSKGLRTVLQSN